MEPSVASATAENVMTMYDLVDKLGTIGILIAMLWYFIKRDRIQETSASSRSEKLEQAAITREQALSSRINALETWHQEVLVGMVQQMSSLISNCTVVMSEVRVTMNNLECSICGGR